MPHLHEVVEIDPHFSIDIETRQIECLADEPPLLTQGDHNSEIFTFSMPRYVEGHDMSLCNLVQVHYLNISAENKSVISSGVYKVLDLQIDPEDNDYLICSWLISQNATLYHGSLNFALRFACTAGAKIEYNWGTYIFSGINVLQSIDNIGAVVTQYADVLEAWYLEFILATNAGINAIEEAVERAEADIIQQVQTSEALEAATQSAVAAIEASAAEAIVNIENAESEAIESEKEELITEIFNRITLSAIPHHYTAEGASF